MPGAEPRHEILKIFSRLFREGPAKQAPPEPLGGFVALDRAQFIEKLEYQLNRDWRQLKKNVTWCEILRKRPCKRTRTKNLRKWSETFSF